MTTEPRLAPYARLPRAYHVRDVLHSTVDAFGRAHWLLRDSARRGDVYDALVLTVEDGRNRTTRLRSVHARFPRVDALPDGGFVVADARRQDGVDQVQVFGSSGHPSCAFDVGDAIEHLLTDETGDLWVGHFDEGVGSDPLCDPGLRCWSSVGEPLWHYHQPPEAGWFLDCYALNVDRRCTWAYPYTDFPLLEVRNRRRARIRTTPVRGAKGVMVDGPRVALYGGYADDHDRLLLGTLTESAIEPVEETRLLRADGARSGRRRVVCRGPRLYVQEENAAEWTLFDIS
ncbi:hypothetical protein [Streptomyces justiciae]|uniref:Uncharacterized protein n=1 Tax=Streptomyces justiciae TaxID=2780140 RepID=A0ABU3LQL1_9ACTN|nr:hypothetical protein [Streptomyces justiciae]MDT7841514.1 hypothetical protein [Streptomyces justiciae]